MKCLITKASDLYRKDDKIIEINTMEELKKFIAEEFSDIIVRGPYYEETEAELVITIYDDYIE